MPPQKVDPLTLDNAETERYCSEGQMEHKRSVSLPCLHDGEPQSVCSIVTGSWKLDL